jgi:hypothetical protein
MGNRYNGSSSLIELGLVNCDGKEGRRYIKWQLMGRP